jgi:hypothetical protein
MRWLAGYYVDVDEKASLSLTGNLSQKRSFQHRDKIQISCLNSLPLKIVGIHSTQKN